METQERVESLRLKIPTIEEPVTNGEKDDKWITKGFLKFLEKIVYIARPSNLV